MYSSVLVVKFFTSWQWRISGPLPIFSGSGFRLSRPRCGANMNWRFSGRSEAADSLLKSKGILFMKETPAQDRAMSLKSSSPAGPEESLVHFSIRPRWAGNSSLPQWFLPADSKYMPNRYIGDLVSLVSQLASLLRSGQGV